MATTLIPGEIISEHTDPGEISFGDLFSTLARGKWVICFASICTALVATVLAFVIPAQYTAESVILTPQQPQSALAAVAPFAGAGGGMNLSGLSLLSGFGLRNPADLYVGILESRTIADALINRFNLKAVYGYQTYQKARKRLSRSTTIRAGKDTLIRIKVDDEDAQRAALLANAYVEELAARNTTVALTEASQRRLFFEQQVGKEKDLLSKAEVALRNTQQGTGLLVPTGQAEALIRSAAQLRAEILSRQAQLSGMKSYVSEDNPRFQAVKQEIATLQSELNTLERGTQATTALDLPVGQLPQAALEYVRKYRDVKYHEALYEAFAKQYEAARLDEAKAAPLIQVIDPAVTPERRSWPPRTIIVLSAAFLAFALSSLFVILSARSQV